MRTTRTGIQGRLNSNSFENDFLVETACEFKEKENVDGMDFVRCEAKIFFGESSEKKML